MSILRIEFKNGEVLEHKYFKLTIKELKEQITSLNANESKYFNLKYNNATIQILKENIKKIIIKQI